jgi:hypothetical protein
VYGGLAVCLFWLMQPSVVTNQGLAAYRPPPNTVVNYGDAPWVPPAESEPRAAFALAPPEQIAEESKVAPKTETKAREVRTAPKRQVRPRPAWNYTSSPFGFRPWF